MEPMYRGIPFSPQTTLTDSIGASDTVIPVADASVFPDPPNYATIGIDADGETISYAAKAGNALSGCTRAVEGTPRSWASGSVIARNFTAKDLESLQENLRAVGRGVQSSWSQNDPDEANFIIGKTHWKEPGPVDSVLLDEAVKFSGKFASVKLLPDLAYGIEVGETYFIVWDGVEYECVAKLDVFGQVIVGNQYIVDKINQTGEPFCLLSQDGDRFFARRSSREEKTITIKIQTRNGVVYHPLPHEYIPDGVPYVQTAAVGQTIVVSEVDVNGKPTAWKVADISTAGGLLTVETITIGDDSGGDSGETETVAVTGLSLDLTSYSAKVGGGFYINPVVSPSNATNKAVAWKSSATTIATVDGNGYVECLAEGNAVITCTTVDGGFVATCAVSVAAESVEVTLTSISATYSGGEVTAGTAVTDLTGIVVTAHYSDGSTAPVTGYTLSGTIAEGSNTITVSYGGKTTTFSVTGVAESGGKVQFSTLERKSGALKADGTTASISKAWNVSFPYTEGMFVSTGTNGGWNISTYPPVLVLDNGTYIAPSLTKSDETINVDGTILTQYSGNLMGYSPSAVVFATVMATGSTAEKVNANMDKSEICYYIPGGEA